MASKIFERKRRPLLRSYEEELREQNETTSKYSTNYGGATRRASRGTGRLQHRGIGGRRLRRGRQNSLIVYLPVVVRKLSTAQTREYQAALRKFRDPFSPEARALAAKYERNIYGLFHPRLSGNFTFSATNGEVLDVLNYHLGAIDSKELDRELRMLGCHRHPDEVSNEMLSESDIDAMGEFMAALMEDDDNEVPEGPKGQDGENEEEEQPVDQNNWSPFGFMK